MKLFKNYDGRVKYWTRDALLVWKGSWFHLRELLGDQRTSALERIEEYMDAATG